MGRSAQAVDVAIIGAGTAGLTAHSAARREGASALLIDAGPLGTTCARVGCMPSKLLIAASDVAHHVEQAQAFGVRTGAVEIDGQAVLTRLRSERHRFVSSVLQVIERMRGDGEFKQARARIEAPGVLRLGSGEDVRFRRLVVATGGAPIVAEAFRGLGDALLTTDQVFEMTDLPQSVVVLGAGSIGLELGQAFHRLGVRTTLLGQGGEVGPLTDPEVSARARQVLSDELDLHLDYQFCRWRPARNGVEFSFIDSLGVERHEHFEKVIMATGRRPNLEGLGLEHYGYSCGEADTPAQSPDIDSGTLQLRETPVFVAGDANGLHPLMHEAADDGRIAGRNAARFPELEAPARRTPLGIVFCDPQMAVVGKSYRQLADCGAVAGAVDYGDQGRARVQATNRGMARIYADHKTHCLVGAELFAPQAEHLGHLLAWAVQQQMTVKEALSMPFYHPVLEEGLRTALRQLATNLGEGSPMKCRVSELGVGS